LKARSFWTWAGIVAWLLYTVVLGMLYLRVPPSADDAVFDYAGWVLCHGGTIYVDVADTNWPAMFWVHTLSTFLFGNTLWSFRALDYLFLVATCLLLGAFVRRYFGMLAGTLVVPIYQAMYVTQSVFFMGERDLWAAPFLILSAFALLRRIEGGKLGWSVVQGVSLALAVLFRPTFLSFMLFMALADFSLRRSTDRPLTRMARDHSVAAISMAGLFLGCALWGWSSGALREWYNVTFRFNLEVYSRTGPSYWTVTGTFLWIILTSWHWMFVLAAVGLVRCWRRHPLPALLLVLIVASSVLSHMVQRKGFGYHLAPLYPVLALFMAPVIASSLKSLMGPLTPSRLPRSARLALAGGVCCVVALGLGKKVVSSLHLQAGWYAGKVTTQELLRHYWAGDDLSLGWTPEIVDYVQRSVPEDGRMLFWGRSMIFNYLAARRSPSRFAAFTCLVDPGPSFSLFDEWRKELQRSFEQRPPELILLLRNPGSPGYRGLPEQGGEGRLGDVVRSALQGRYVLEKSFDSVDCFRLQGR